MMAEGNRLSDLEMSITGHHRGRLGFGSVD